MKHGITNTLLALLVLPVLTAAAATQDTLIPDDCKGEAYKPSKIVIACGDGNLFMSRIKWSSWTADRAAGKGTLNVNLCEPNCAKGRFKRFPATIRLSRRGTCAPKGGVGPSVFKRLSYTYTASRPKGAKRTTTQSVPCPDATTSLAGVAKRRHAPCAFRGYRVLRKTRTARILESPNGSVSGCLLATGKRRHLEDVDDLYSNLSHPTLAGRFAAYVYSEVPACKADCPPDVHGVAYIGVVNLATGASRHVDGVPTTSLVLSAGGTVAWDQSAGTGGSDLKVNDGATRTLDTGKIGSLKISGTSLSWTRDGQPQATQVR